MDAHRISFLSYSIAFSLASADAGTWTARARIDFRSSRVICTSRQRFFVSYRNCNLLDDLLSLRPGRTADRRDGCSGGCVERIRMAGMEAHCDDRSGQQSAGADDDHNEHDDNGSHHHDGLDHDNGLDIDHDHHDAAWHMRRLLRAGIPSGYPLGNTQDNADTILQGLCDSHGSPWDADCNDGPGRHRGLDARVRAVRRDA